MTAPLAPVDARTGPVRIRHDEHTASMLRTIKAIENHPTLTAADAACIEARYHQLGVNLIEVDDNTRDRLTALSIKTGRTPGELVAIFVKFSTPVDAGHPPAPGSPDVEPGQGEAQPPAPTNARVLVPTEADRRRNIACTEYPDGERLCQTAPTWWCRTEGRPGRACCDDHIPDGWVRPDTDPVADALALVGLPAHKQPPALTAASDQHQAREAAGHIPPHVHLNGGPCVYGEACDQ